MYSWWWVRLSPETCKVKPLRRMKTQLLHLVGLISLLYKSTSPPNTKKSNKPLTTHTANFFTQNILTAELPLIEGSWVTISIFRGSKYTNTIKVNCRSPNSGIWWSVKLWWLSVIRLVNGWRSGLYVVGGDFSPWHIVQSSSGANRTKQPGRKSLSTWGVVNIPNPSFLPTHEYC